MNRPLLLCLIALFAVLVLADPAFAGFTSWMSGFANRSRVIQICMAVVGLALFIMMKKFTDR